jgi:hypothetical protein
VLLSRGGNGGLEFAEFGFIGSQRFGLEISAKGLSVNEIRGSFLLLSRESHDKGSQICETAFIDFRDILCCIGDSGASKLEVISCEGVEKYVGLEGKGSLGDTLAV